MKQADIGNIFSSTGSAVNVNTVIAATRYPDTPAVASTSGTSGAFTAATLAAADNYTLNVGR